MTENDKPPSEKPPGIELGYAAPLRQAAGPTPFQVFAGTVSVLLGLVPLAAGAGILCVAASALLHFNTPGPSDERLSILGAIVVVLGFAFGIGIAVPFFFASIAMFRMARRLFSGSRNIVRSVSSHK